MKFSWIIMVAGVVTVSLTSCKKDYSCQCNYQEQHDDHFDDASVNYPLGSLSKKDAESACDTKATALSAEPEHQNVDCKIKK